MISSAILTKAKATLLEAGWGQGDAETICYGGTKYCVVTAISCATAGDKFPSKTFDDATFAFLTANPHIKKPLAEWNDERSRRLEDVLSAFDSAIAFAKRIEAMRPSVTKG